MFKLLEIELRKLLPYRAFWVAVLAYVLLMPGLFISLHRLQINVQTFTLDFSFYNFPEVWHNSAYIASWFNILLYFFVLLVVTNEYQFRTLRQNVIDGLSRWQVVGAKTLLLLVFGLGSTALVALLALLSGLFLSENPDHSQMFVRTEYLGYYFVQLLGYLAFAQLVGNLVRKQGMSIIVYLGYSLVVETILRYRVLPEGWGQYLPLQVLGKLLPNPIPSYFGMPASPAPDTQIFALAAVYTVGFVLLSAWVVHRRDL